VNLIGNFVFFLLENKTFLNFYELDYYSDKTVQMIAHKIGRKEEEIENYLLETNYKIDNEYPLRYISSYKIDRELGGNYDFLKYKEEHQYQGNYDCRR
jgi:hypothetical protein